MIRTRLTGLVAAFLILLPALVPATERPLRSYVAPQGRDDDRPRPLAVPAVAVEQRLLPPPGPADTAPEDTVFAAACSAADAAGLMPGAAPRPARCAEPFTVIPEFP